MNAYLHPGVNVAEGAAGGENESFSCSVWFFGNTEYVGLLELNA
jgi:hypothetical protein